VIVRSRRAAATGFRAACRELTIVVVGVSVLAGCSGGPAVHVAVPRGPGAGCARLHDALPSSLDGRSARDTTPASVRTAAWGAPAVVLRCGVGRPAGLAPTSQLVEVNGVDWFLGEPSPPYVFTAVGRGTFVQLRVPRSVPRTEATAPLAELAAAVKRSLPRR
jgi:hypothetical protein